MRAFTKHENDILLGVTEARAAALQAATPEMQLTAEKNLTQNINALIGMAERYPDSRPRRISVSCDRSCRRREPRHRFAPLLHLAVEEYATTLRQFPGSYIGRLSKMNVRMPFDLGIERVLLDEPLALKF